MRTFPGRSCADAETPVGEAVVDKDAAAKRGKGEWQPQKSCAQRDVDCQITAVRGPLPVKCLISEIICWCSLRLHLCTRQLVSHSKGESGHVGCTKQTLLQKSACNRALAARLKGVLRIADLGEHCSNMETVIIERMPSPMPQLSIVKDIL